MTHKQRAVLVFVCGLAGGFYAGFHHDTSWGPALYGGIAGALATAVYQYGEDEQ